jgi:predicted MPP superfamily phosphohydrolase
VTMTLAPLTELIVPRSLSQRLARRMAIEAENARAGRWGHKGPLSAWCERSLIKPLLKYGLKAAGLYSRGVGNALRPVVRNIRLTLADLPAAFDGFTILQLSDLHIDGVDGLTEILTEMLGDVRADICVLTGDYRFEVDGPHELAYTRMRTILSSVRSRYGTFGILGNHDPSEMAFLFEELGVRMLVNDAAEIERADASLWLMGVDDPYDYRCDDLESALASVPGDGFKILLAHTPEMYVEASNNAIQLYLCGHTHGGQIRLPGIGHLRQNAECPRSYAQGHWKYNDMHGYTSAGVGCSMLPVRFNCPPEIVLIELACER